MQMRVVANKLYLQRRLTSAQTFLNFHLSVCFFSARSSDVFLNSSILCNIIAPWFSRSSILFPSYSRLKHPPLEGGEGSPGSGCDLNKAQKVPRVTRLGVGYKGVK